MGKRSTKKNSLFIIDHCPHTAEFVNHCCKNNGKVFSTKLSQKTCQINVNIFQLSGERLEDLRV